MTQAVGLDELWAVQAHVHVPDVRGCIDVCATYAGWVCLLCIHVYELCMWVYSRVFMCGTYVHRCVCVGVGYAYLHM